MIGKCSECGKRRKLYHAVGSTINALWCAECIAKHKDNIWRVYEIDEEAICHLRKTAYGLSACRNCPVSCPISQDNLNRLSNIETILEQIRPRISQQDDLITKIAKLYGLSKEYVANNISEFIKEQ